MADRKKIIICILSFGLWVTASLFIPQKKDINQSSSSIKERIADSRYLSLGHTRSSDIISSIQLLSSCFEVVEFLKTHPKDKVIESTAWKRFNENKSKIEGISKLNLGFNEFISSLQ